MLQKPQRHPRPADPTNANVHRLVYAIRVASTDSLFEQMEKLRAAALRLAQRHQVAAMLLYQSGWFIYWVEGSALEVKVFMDDVSRLQHHHSQILLHHSLGRRYLLTAWSMMMAPSTERPAAFAERIKELRAYLQRGLQFPPTSVIRRLSAPMRLGDARMQADPDRFRRLGVCSASGDRGFSLVRWLAGERKQPVYSRRFSGTQDTDSGSDYVEFMEGGEPCRVIAISRRGLTHSVRRAFLPDWPFLLLMLSGKPEHDQALMTRLAAAFHDLPCCPELVWCAPDKDTGESMAALAKSLDLRYTPALPADPDDLAAIWRATAEVMARSGPLMSSRLELPVPAANV
jgi:hypothetical protein